MLEIEAGVNMKWELTVCVCAPEGTAGARLMTCISPCAATTLAATDSAAKYFIMTKVLMLDVRIVKGCLLVERT
jgi:hypothetical protein